MTKQAKFLLPLSWKDGKPLFSEVSIIYRDKLPEPKRMVFINTTIEEAKELFNDITVNWSNAVTKVFNVIGHGKITTQKWIF